jgi:SPP1 family predicted phage head-tail adaptor
MSGVGYRPQRFHLAEMNSLITVKNETTTQDSAGQPVVTLSTWLKDEPAKWEPTTGGEGTRGRQVESGIAAVFTVHYRDGYTPKMEVVCEGQTYGIVYVNPVGGMNAYRELHCKAVVI